MRKWDNKYEQVFSGNWTIKWRKRKVAKENLRLRENIYLVENALNLYSSERAIKKEIVEATEGDG